MYSKMNEFIDSVKIKNPNEHEFHQAVEEVVESIWDFVLDKGTKYSTLISYLTYLEFK